MKKIVLLFLIVSQASFASAVWATETPTQATSPETTLLEGVLALQGENLSTQERTAQTQQLLSTYMSAANPTGAPDRLEQAMVTLGISTPVQAQRMFQAAQTSSQKLLSANESTQAQMEQEVQSQLTQLIQLSPQGAEFSQCTGLDVGGASALAGVASMIAGIFVYSHQVCPAGETQFNTNGGMGCLGGSPVQPDSGVGIGMEIGGGIALVIGTILTITHQDC